MYSELLLTVAVVASVVLFGALITRGNERQRRSIEKLYTAYKQWAVHDLRIKRGVASSQIKIDDLTFWLKKVTSQALDRETIVLEYYKHETPIASVEFHDASTGSTVVCALESPDEVNKLLKKKRPTIAGDLRSNPIFRLGKKTQVVEISMLNAGVMFDLELPVAWNLLTGHQTTSETLWAYVLD